MTANERRSKRSRSYPPRQAGAFENLPALLAAQDRDSAQYESLSAAEIMRLLTQRPAPPHLPIIGTCTLPASIKEGEQDR